MKNLASLAVLLLSVPGVLLANAYQLQAESTQLPFKVVQELILVDASVNGQEGKFLFDTGAADLTLNISHFATNSRPSKNHYIADINGFNHNPRLLDVQHFVLGMVERKNFTVPVINLSVLERELGESILGVIGYKVIRNFEIVFDYYERIIHLVQLEKKGKPLVNMTQTPPDYTFEIRMENFLPVLQTQLEGKTLDLALDSGAAVNIVDQQFKEHLMSKAAQVRSMQLGGAFSEVKTVEVCTYTHIVLDKQLAVKWWRAAFNDLSHLVRENIKIDGIIGVGFFQYGKVVLNYQQKIVKIWSVDKSFTGRFFKPTVQ